MARSKSTEWIVPRNYGVLETVPGGATLDLALVDLTDVFDAYGTDEVTVLAVKGHVVFAEASQVVAYATGWRIRKALQDLTTGVITTVGAINTAAAAEEHFLTERWFVLDPADVAAVNPYFTKVDVSNKRIVRRGEALVFSTHTITVGGELEYRLFVRVLVLL